MTNDHAHTLDVCFDSRRLLWRDSCGIVTTKVSCVIGVASCCRFLVVSRSKMGSNASSRKTRWRSIKGQPGRTSQACGHCDVRCAVPFLRRPEGLVGSGIQLWAHSTWAARSPRSSCLKLSSQHQESWKPLTRLRGCKTCFFWSFRQYTSIAHTAFDAHHYCVKQSLN